MHEFLCGVCENCEAQSFPYYSMPAHIVYFYRCSSVLFMHFLVRQISSKRHAPMALSLEWRRRNHLS